MDIVMELNHRLEKLQEVMKEKKLDTVLFVGNSAVGPLSYGCFRYFTDYKVYYHLQAMTVRLDEPVTVCCGSILHLEGLHKRGFSDIRVSPDILGSVLKIFSEKQPHRLGVSMEMLPANWFVEIKKKYPNIVLVDITQEVFALRNNHSEYEVQCIRECAKIADKGYQAVCEIVKPGIKMCDLHTELDYALKRAGAEETFTLMSNGKFSYHNNQLPCIQAFSWPDERVVRQGDDVAMEITPRYKGYWTQMVRTVCIGEPNPDLEKAHALSLKVIDATTQLLKPGMFLGSILKSMWFQIQELGYTPKLPFGHIMGLDLDEGGRGSLESELVLSKNVNVVLHPTIVCGEMDYSIFWGDSFLVTDNGGMRINGSSTQLAIL